MEVKLLTDQTTSPVTGVPHKIGNHPPHRAYQATVAGPGAVTATVVIYVSTDGTNFIELATITLSGTTSATDGFASATGWSWVRANITAISGTGATINATMAAA